MIVGILSMVILASGTFCALELTSTRRRTIVAQLRRANSYAHITPREQEMAKSAHERLLRPLVKHFTDLAIRISPQGKRVELTRKLQQAGLRTPAQVILAVKGGLLIGGITFGVLGSIVTHNTMMMTVGLIIFAVGFIGPDIWLNGKIRRRIDAMDRSLPDMLDLLTVSVEAGLGFDAAVAKVCEKMSGPLIDEMSLVAREIRIGETRRQALQNLGERAGSEDIQAFARAIVQAEELGTSLGRTLKVQADDMRVHRQLTAEEKAMKAPIKMLFPTVLFIFPAMFIVILGPAVMNIMGALASTGG